MSPLQAWLHIKRNYKTTIDSEYRQLFAKLNLKNIWQIFDVPFKEKIIIYNNLIVTLFIIVTMNQLV